MDKFFRVEVISQTINPQQVIYAAMHQDYSEDFVFESQSKWPNEQKCGDIIVKNLLSGDRGHYGPLEMINIVFNCGYFPHGVIQQATRHRLLSFDCQSLRYTSVHILKVAKGEKEVEEVFYLRPPGYYSDRSGKKYFYSEDQRTNDLLWCVEASKRYYEDLNTYGMSEEHARGKLPFDYRQHFVVSFNCRSLMHFLDMRYKADAQLEIQQMCELIIPHFKKWTPQVYEWYKERRLKKARLAP